MNFSGYILKFLYLNSSKKTIYGQESPECISIFKLVLTTIAIDCLIIPGTQR